MRCAIHRVPTRDPSDVSELEQSFVSGTVNPEHVIAVMGKTEGNGCVNDFSRGLAVSKVRECLARRVGVERASRILYIMSGGTEGVLSPHITVITRSDSVGGGKPNGGRLAVGVAQTAAIAPEEIGRLAQVDLVTEAVRRAMKHAAVEDVADVHFVQIKCPLLTPQALADAQSRGKPTVTTDPYWSMSYSRGASSLGVAVALGEVSRASLTDDAICRRWDLYSSVASASAGNELTNVEVLLFAMSREAHGDHYISHAVMEDAIDIHSVRDAARSVNMRLRGEEPESSDVRAVDFVQAFVKAEADPRGTVRGRRHTMCSDSDIHHSRHARAAVGGLLAACLGDPMLYVSGGAEHQGPPGGGPLAFVVKDIA